MAKGNGKSYHNIHEVPAVVRRAIRTCTIHKVDFDAVPDYTEENSDRVEVETLPEANNISSLDKETGGHKYLLLDIDLPAALLESSTKGHGHLYVELPEETNEYRLTDFLRAAARIGLIDVGYAEASIHRGFTSLRLPWVRKRDIFDAAE